MELELRKREKISVSHSSRHIRARIVTSMSNESRRIYAEGVRTPRKLEGTVDDFIDSANYWKYVDRAVQHDAGSQSHSLGRLHGDSSLFVHDAA